MRRCVFQAPARSQFPHCCDFSETKQEALAYPKRRPFAVRYRLRWFLLARAFAPFMVELFAAECLARSPVLS